MSNKPPPAWSVRVGRGGRGAAPPELSEEIREAERERPAGLAGRLFFNCFNHLDSGALRWEFAIPGEGQPSPVATHFMAGLRMALDVLAELETGRYDTVSLAFVSLMQPQEPALPPLPPTSRDLPTYAQGLALFYRIVSSSLSIPRPLDWAMLSCTRVA